MLIRADPALLCGLRPLQAVEAAVASGEHAKAVRTALAPTSRTSWRRRCSACPEKLPIAAAAVPVHRLPALLAALARLARPLP